MKIKSNDAFLTSDFLSACLDLVRFGICEWKKNAPNKQLPARDACHVMQWPPASVTDVLSSRPLPEALQLLHGLELQPSSEWTSAALKLWLKGQGSKLTVAEVHDLMNSLCLMYDFDSVAGVHTALDTPPGEVPLLPGSRPGAPTNPWETLSCTAVPDDEAGMMSMPAGSPRRRSGSLGGSRRYSRGSSGGGALAAQASSGSMSGLACDCVEEDPVQCLRQWLDQAVGALLDNGVLMAHQLQDLYSTLSCLSITPSTGTVLRLYADAYPPSHPGSIATLLWLSALAGAHAHGVPAAWAHLPALTPRALSACIITPMSQFCRSTHGMIVCMLCVTRWFLLQVCSCPQV